MKFVPPSISETAFNCPHCGALAKQFWSSLQTDNNNEKNPLPFLIDAKAENDFKNIEDDDEQRKMADLFRRLKTHLPFVEGSKATLYGDAVVYNAFISRCFNCKEIAFWIGEKLIYPTKGEAPPANPDLPPDIRRDYNEASSILDLSPRGAAALVRLCIQKLCKHLGQPGENINTDIAALVRDGLSNRVQQALDVVRVIGNNAVHPGTIDLTDDKATAETLFKLLNIIAEKMISEPKHIDEVYGTLPPGALAAITKRDGKL